MTYPTVIRASSLPGYSDCGRRWAASTLRKELAEAGYDLNVTLRISVGASVGTGVHGGAAHMLLEKMNTGDLGNAQEAVDFGISEFEAHSKDGILWDDVTQNANDAQQQVRRMVQVYRATIAQEITPVAVERRLEAAVGDGFVLSGQSDLQVLNPGQIRDTKTGKTMRAHYAQVGSYSMLARTAHKEFPVNGLVVDFIPRVNLKKPQPLPISEHYDQVTAENAAQAAIDHIRIAVGEFRRRVQEGDAPPEHAFLANPSSLLCSPKYCGAWGTNFCNEHKKGKASS
jgi:PD-(D/E)XK nuclease superfamily